MRMDTQRTKMQIDRESHRRHTQLKGSRFSLAIVERSALAPYVAGFELAGMPQVILRVRGAKPALALVAEDGGGFVARLVQVGNRFARRFCFVSRIFPGRLCFHGDTRPVIVLLPGAIGSEVSIQPGACLAL